MNKIKILAPSYVIPISEVDGLVELRERIEIKLHQLESDGFEDFGGLGTGEDLTFAKMALDYRVMHVAPPGRICRNNCTLRSRRNGCRFADRCGRTR
jgi:hypothetical protein